MAKYFLLSAVCIFAISTLTSCIVTPQVSGDYEPFYYNSSESSSSQNNSTSTSSTNNSAPDSAEENKTDSSNPDFSFENASTSNVKLSFRKGDTLQWDTGLGKGNMKVLEVKGGNFKLEQYNILNKAAKEVIMVGQIQKNGSCVIKNPEWKEVWTGDLHGNSIVGKVNNITNFKITWKVPSYLSHSVISSPKVPFSRGDVLKWESGQVRGTMKVTSLKNDKFSIEKYNDFDKKTSPVKMEGVVDKNGDCCIKSSNGKEIWSGKLSNNIIKGKVNNGYNFKISRSNSVWDMPFKQGSVLNWSTNIRKGTIKVVSLSSNGKFVFDVYGSNSKYFRETKLNGEILGDGTYRLKDTKSDEVWIGRRDLGEISGKIDNETKFKITGLK